MDAMDKLRAIAELDVNDGLTHVANNATLYQKITKMLASGGADQIAKMDEMLAAGDMLNFAIAIHGQKGALANLGAKGLSAQALSMEIKAKAGDAANIPAEYEPFKAAYIALCADIAAALE